MLEMKSTQFSCESFKIYKSLNSSPMLKSASAQIGVVDQDIVSTAI